MDYSNEQRQHLRYEVLDYALIYTDAEEPIRSVVVDIGLGGLQVRTREPIPNGTSCDLKIGNMEHPPVSIRGEVRYVQPVPGCELYSVGIRFLPESHQQRADVAEYVHSVFQRQAETLIS
jgi:c-di-GMP-binding flagellar brake protein YcgR